jgi:4-amino-4-deoxy-L-arabinose transferase-like glycosyltransferase
MAQSNTPSSLKINDGRSFFHCGLRGQNPFLTMYVKGFAIRFNRIFDILAVAAAATFVVIAAYRIHLPGLYYDEVLFVNAAEGGSLDNFIYKRVGNVPVMVMPYIGALKSWLYYPVFATFGVSVWTIRLPAILIAAATLLIYYLLLRKMLGPGWACGVTWLMALSPAFIFFSKLDLGPFVLMQFFKATMLFLWFAHLEKPSFRKLAGLGACAIFGFFDKFNFIWLILALAGGVIFVYPEEIHRIWKSLSLPLRFTCALIGMAGSAAAASLVFPLLRFPAAGSANCLDRISTTWFGILNTLSGTTLASFIFGSNEGVFTFEPWGTLLPAMLAGAACLLLQNNDVGFRARRKAGCFCMTTMILVFIQIAITPQATAPWHYVMVFPFSVLALAFFTRAITQHLANDKRQFPTARVFTALTVAAVTALAFANAANTFNYLRHFKTSLAYTPRWSPSIYKLAAFISKEGMNVDKIICIDWGLMNQLEALSSTEIKKKLQDDWAFFKDLGESSRPSAPDDLVPMFIKGRSLAVTFAESKETFPAARRAFLARVDSSLFEIHLLKQINSHHERLYDIYEVTGTLPK